MDGCLNCLLFSLFVAFLFLSTTLGCDIELMEDIKGLTAGVPSRKRGKRRYFWEYSEQLTPSKQERMLKPSEWDRHTLPSNLYQKNGPLHGTHTNKLYIFRGIPLILLLSLGKLYENLQRHFLKDDLIIWSYIFFDIYFGIKPLYGFCMG